MSQEHELPGETRLAEIESQLKRIQPLSPRLDLAAIVELAHEPPATKRTALRPYRAMGLSWMCGALAGAMLMYFCVGRPRAAAPESEITRLVNQPDGEASDKRAVDPPREPQKENVVTSAEEPPQRPDAASLVLAALSDPRGSFPPSGLRAGAHLPGVAKARTHDADQATAAASSRRSDPSPLEATPPRSWQGDLEPSPGITRGELMRRLLQGNQI